MIFWQSLGNYEYEVGASGYTGWCRCIGGKLADGRWPEWNGYTGEQRFS